MKRSLLAMSVLSAMLIACSSAAAGGVNLAWTNCASEGGTTNRTSTCLVNTGSDALVGSFVLNTDQAGCTGIEVVLDVIGGEGSRRSPRGGT